MEHPLTAKKEVTKREIDGYFLEMVYGRRMFDAEQIFEPIKVEGATDEPLAFDYDPKKIVPIEFDFTAHEKITTSINNENVLKHVLRHFHRFIFKGATVQHLEEVYKDLKTYVYRICVAINRYLFIPIGN